MDKITQSVEEISSQLNENQIEVDGLKQVNDSENIKIELQLKSVHSLIEKVKISSGISSEKLKKLVNELKSINKEVNEVTSLTSYFTLLKDFISLQVEKDAQIKCKRGSALAELRKTCDIWEKQKAIKDEAKKKERENMLQKINEKKGKIRQIEAECLRKKLLTEQNRNLLEKLPSIISELKAEEQNLISSTTDRKEKQEKEWSIACSQVFELDESLRQKLTEKEKIKEEYDEMLQVKLEAENNLTRCRELENTIQQINFEVQKKSEQLSFLKSQELALLNEKEAKMKAFDAKKSANEEKLKSLDLVISEKTQIFEDIVQESSNYEENIATYREKISRIEKEYSIWKQALLEKDDSDASDEEVELDNEIQEIQEKIDQLKKEKEVVAEKERYAREVKAEAERIVLETKKNEEILKAEAVNNANNSQFIGSSQHTGQIIKPALELNTESFQNVKSSQVDQELTQYLIENELIDKVSGRKISEENNEPTQTLESQEVQNLMNKAPNDDNKKFELKESSQKSSIFGQQKDTELVQPTVFSKKSQEFCLENMGSKVETQIPSSVDYSKAYLERIALSADQKRNSEEKSSIKKEVRQKKDDIFPQNSQSKRTYCRASKNIANQNISEIAKQILEGENKPDKIESRRTRKNFPKPSSSTLECGEDPYNFISSLKDEKNSQELIKDPSKMRRQK